ncbi:MAG: RidA family protein [[Eubacterium] brachy]|nr:RidA family protein [[Eubacterium] brachy]
MKKIISTKNVPDAIGPYSQGIEAVGFVFTSGQLGLVPETGEFAGNDVKSQAIQAFENLREILKASDCTLDDVVKTTCFLKNMDDFVIVNEVYTRFLSGENYPARSAVEVAALPKGGLVEIEAIAMKK